jgi:hypothetical protein
MQEKPFNGKEPKNKKRRSTLVQSRETPLRLRNVWRLEAWSRAAKYLNIQTSNSFFLVF